MSKNAKTREPVVLLAIQAAGGPAALARELGVTTAAVSQWTVIPIERARAVARITEIPLHVLRPDIWGAVGNGRRTVEIRAG